MNSIEKSVESRAREVLRSERGSTMIECAVTMPLLAVMAMGVFSMGVQLDRFLTAQQVARAAARLEVLGVDLTMAANQNLILAGLGNKGWLIKVRTVEVDPVLGPTVLRTVQFGDSEVEKVPGLDLNKLPAGLPSSTAAPITVGQAYYCPSVEGLPTLLSVPWLTGTAIF